MNKPYLYVQATVEAICDPEGKGRHRGPDAIRFQHTVVMAENESSAYTLGGRHAQAEKWVPVQDGEMANDYVVEIGPLE